MRPVRNRKGKKNGIHNLASNATRVEFTRFCQYLYPATHHENYWSHFLGHPDLGQDKVILSLNEPPPRNKNGRDHLWQCH